MFSSPIEELITLLPLIEDYNPDYWGDGNPSAPPFHDAGAHVKARTSLVAPVQPFGEISTGYL